MVIFNTPMFISNINKYHRNAFWCIARCLVHYGIRKYRSPSANTGLQEAIVAVVLLRPHYAVSWYSSNLRIGLCICAIVFLFFILISILVTLYNTILLDQLNKIFGQLQWQFATVFLNLLTCSAIAGNWRQYIVEEN